MPLLDRSSLKGVAVLKKLTPLAVAAGLLGSVLTATEAAAADPAPSAVMVAWKDSTHEVVRVTWTDAGDLPNKVVVRPVGGTKTALPVFVPAGAANVVDYPATRLQAVAETLQIEVAAGETGPAGVSPRFDTTPAVPVSKVSATMSGSSALRVEWKPLPVSGTDSTPNDPLDLTATTLYTPRIVAGGKITDLAAASAATAISFTGPPPPYRFEVVATNEWGSFSSDLVRAEPSRLTAVIPAWAKAASPLSGPAITGTFGGDRAQVILQARTTASSPWSVVASQPNYDGTYRFDLGASGSRQYRVQVPNRADDRSNVVYFGGFSQAQTTTIQVNPYDVRWMPTTVKRGQTATALLSSSPAANYTAILQRWTGKTWSTVGPVTTATGLARGYVKGGALGRVAYRYYVPAMTVKGLPYAAAYSANFVLTTVA
ncbi:hypothetical protein [Kribbella sp. NPDC051770]|uniref:hypothetical protein n=1 Tax=Kribbella sp. NPDC051770 TaxID=3155413 RepID=UPI00344A8C24